MALYDNPTELWQVRANETGMDVSNPSTWNTQLGQSSPWANEHGINAMWQGAQRYNENVYDQANGGRPALNMVQGADGNWTNTNADANQLYVKNKLDALNPTPAQPQAPATPASFWSSASQPSATTAQTTPYPNPTELWQVQANNAQPQGGLDMYAQAQRVTDPNWMAPGETWTNDQYIKAQQAVDPSYMSAGNVAQAQNYWNTVDPAAASQRYGINLQRDPSGNWYNADVGITPAAQTPETMYQTNPASNFVYGTQSGDGSLTGAQPLNLQQDASGNWYNANAAQMSPIPGTGGPSTVDTSQAAQDNTALMNQQRATIAADLAAQRAVHDNAVSSYQNSNLATKMGVGNQAASEMAAQNATHDASTLNYNNGLASRMGLVQDAQGNWSNPNGDTMQANMAKTLGTAPSDNNAAVMSDPTAYWNQQGGQWSDAQYAANMKSVDPTWVDPSSVDVNAQKAQTAADVAAQRAALNPSSTAANYQGTPEEQAARADYLAGYDQRMAPYRAQYLASQGINVQNLINDQKTNGVSPVDAMANSWNALSNTWADPNYVPISKYQASIDQANNYLGAQTDWGSHPNSASVGGIGASNTGGIGGNQLSQWQINASNTANKAKASSTALQGLAAALQPNSGATADEIAQLLSQSKILEDSFGNAYDAGGTGTQGWYDQIGQALGGYDYAKAMADMRATPYASNEDAQQRWDSALQQVAQYLASPDHKIDSGVLSQLAQNVGGYWGNTNASNQEMIDFTKMMSQIK